MYLAGRLSLERARRAISGPARFGLESSALAVKISQISDPIRVSSTVIANEWYVNIVPSPSRSSSDDTLVTEHIIGMGAKVLVLKCGCRHVSLYSCVGHHLVGANLRLQRSVSTSSLLFAIAERFSDKNGRTDVDVHCGPE